MITSRVCPSARRPVCFALICGLVLVADLAWAGQGSDATIFGQITDESGAVLPGVTVTVEGPALQVKQIVVVSDLRGEYRVTPLPLGTYSMEFTLQGFQTQRNEGLRLTAGFVARVDVALKVGTLQESVTVSGQSPVVDLKTTSAGTQVTQEILESVPTARNSFNSLLTLAAGARPAMETGQVRGADPVLKAFGRAGEGWITIDGLGVTAPTGSVGHQTAFNYAAIEEAAVQTIGSSAEAPTSGIQLNVITKSGGNAFHGSGLAAQTANWMQAADNRDDRLKAQGIQESAQYSERWDTGSDLGGRLVRDKLWFYGGARMRQEGIGIIGAFNADGSPSQAETDQRFVSGKLTNQLTASQQLIGSYHWRRQYRFNGPSTRFHDVDTSRAVTYLTKQSQIQLQIVKGNRILSLQGGGHSVVFPVNPVFTQNSAWRDEVTGWQGGIEEDAGSRRELMRWEAKGTLNWYKPELVGGSHDFKVGVHYFLAYRPWLWVDNGDPIGNYVLFYRNSVPFAVEAKNSPVNPVPRLGYVGTFVQDSWSLNRRLTLNLGVRYASDGAWLPEQCRVAAPREFAALFPAECFPRRELNTWNSVQPRLNAAYDVTGTGKTVIKGGWGRFNVLHKQEELDIANPNARRVARFLWRDLNGNRRFDVGESNLNLNGPDFVSLLVFSQSCNTCIAAGETGALAGLVDNADLDAPGSDEFSLSLERELMGNFAMRVTGVYARDFNRLRTLNTLRPPEVYTIPIPNPDPGLDGVVGNADDPGTFITYFDYPASLRGVAFQRTMFINHAGSDANYKSFELALNKRMSNRWQMLASYSASKKHIPIPDRAPLTPNAEIFEADDTWEWLFRASGSYLLPGDIQVGANVVTQSGQAWARTVSVRGGQQIPSVTLKVEPLGTQRTPTETLVSLSVEKAFPLRAGQRLSVGASVFNLLNANFDLNLPQTRAGNRFGYSADVMPPRYGEVTVRYTF